MKWYGIEPSCSKCGQPVTLIDIAVRADNYILFSGVCIMCGEERQVKTSLANLLLQCQQKDKEGGDGEHDPKEDC